MFVARQEAAWLARSSYYASLYSAAQASQTASGRNNDDGQVFKSDEDDNNTEPAFLTATALAFGPTTATLGNGAKTTTSGSVAASQTQTSNAVPTTESAIQSSITPSMTTSYSWTQPAWRPGWHSYAPSYINTATSPSETSATSLTPALSTQEKAHHGPNTTIIAAIVIPIVILLASGLVALTCLRKRRKRAVMCGTGDAAVVGVAEPIVMAEKIAEKKPSSNIHHTTRSTMLSPIDEASAAPQLPQLVITSSQNATYFTGLDTFSVHSTATSEDPPPPYRARSMLSHTSSERRQPSIVQTAALAPVSPISPVSPLAHLASPFSDNNAISVSRSPSQKSFASTLYSSNASVYEARPARRSTGPAEYVISPRSSFEEPIRMRSPFDDPEDEIVDERREGS